jgi:flavin reductase (DIM6/NTAB) family NADH-FMN oxidoreductase RutF
MTGYRKKDFPIDKVRRFLEPGPVVLVSSRWENRTDIMTMGWHMMMEFNPSLIGCVISSANHSFEMIRNSRECVINLPTSDMVRKVIGIGNVKGGDTDKFKAFKLTAKNAGKVKAPLIKECYANFECKLADDTRVERYNMFVFEVVKAHVASSPKYPETVHYRGEGVFMVSGKSASYRKLFKIKNM